MKLIGLTGQMGTGKTTVLEEFKKYKFTLVAPCDDISRSIIFHKSSKPVLSGIFGEDGFTDGVPDLCKLGEIVFSDDEKKEKLEQFIFPLIWKIIEKMVIDNPKHDLLVVEAAALFEKGWESKFDKVIVTNCSKGEQYRRLTEIRGKTLDEIAARLRHQSSQADKIKSADFVIETECDKNRLACVVKEVRHELYSGIKRVGALY